MSQDSFIFNFNVKEFETGQKFPKSNVVELEGSKWYLGIEKKGINDRFSLCYEKVLDICLSCERGTPSGIYLVNLALILRGSLIDVLFTRTYYFKPLDLELHCFKIDYNYLLDNDNGFIDENGEGKIMAEISVKRVDDKEIFELHAAHQEISSFPQELNGSINLQGGHRMFVNKELLSRHSKYFDNIFNNENFVESSQESIDLTDFTYNQFRLLHKHIYDTRAQFTDGSLEFMLKSKDGVKEFQKLRTLPHVRGRFCQRYTKLLHQRSEDTSKNLLKETLCMFDDLKQMSTLIGLIFCVFTDYVRRQNQTVSAENIEDLLSVGSYFQISKIVDSCKEFLNRNTFYPDCSVRRRMELAEKYNLTSVTVTAINPVNPLKHQWNADSTRLKPTVLVQLTFLDTGKEIVCSVKFIDGMTVQTLFFTAFTSICFKRVSNADWFDPLDHKIENVRISDLETHSEVEYQRKDIDDNPALLFAVAHSSRIYNFEVRRIQYESMGMDDISPSTSAGTGQQVSKIQPPFQFSIPSSVLVSVTFLDTGIHELCTVPHRTGMNVEKLLSTTLLILYTRDKTNKMSQPSNYELEAARVSKNRSEAEPLDVLYPMSDLVLTCQRYNFDVRLKMVQDDPESYSQDHQRFIGLEPQSLEDIRLRSLEIGETQKILPDKSLPDILVHVTFLDTGVNEMCAVQYQDGMSIQWLFFHALSSLHSKNKSSSPLDYKLERVGVSNPGSTSGGQAETSFLNFEGVMFGQVLTSEIYKFEVRLKIEENYLESKEMPTNSKMPPTEAPNVDRMPTEILVLLNFLDINDQEFCTVPYKPGMSVQNLLFIAFMTLKDSRSPFEYEIESVYVSDSNSTSDSEPDSLRPQDIEAISVNSSYSYSFDMRRKTDEPSTSKEKQ
ncbi:BTB/POZ domain-containing protein [Ditylenchus destructor]|nr:BTB/POZ domain-containing protein [Ditylenchus destructor]